MDGRIPKVCSIKFTFEYADKFVAGLLYLNIKNLSEDFMDFKIGYNARVREQNYYNYP